MQLNLLLSSLVILLTRRFVTVEARGIARAMGNPPPGVRIPDEQRLYQTIMDGYETAVRPVINVSQILVITFGLKLNQIIDLDEKHQVLTTNVFIDQVRSLGPVDQYQKGIINGEIRYVIQEWTDSMLFWNPSDYNNVRTMRIPAHRVWLPDTFVYNNADSGSTGFMQSKYVLVNYQGKVRWPVPVKLMSSCKMDITYFPFDDQKCVIKFGSWIYSGLWLDFVPMDNSTPVDVSTYVNNSEWDLVSITAEKRRREHSCCNEPYNDMTFTLHMRRRTFYYIFNIIIPCMMLSVLTMLTFWLPPTSGEKITLGLSVFLAFSMFMLLIAEEVPATSESAPLIGIYLCVVMTMTSLSVIMAVMVINLYNRGAKTRRAPRWLRAITVNCLAKLMRVESNLEKMASMVTLQEERDNVYQCVKHRNATTFSQGSGRYRNDRVHADIATYRRCNSQRYNIQPGSHGYRNQQPRQISELQQSFLGNERLLNDNNKQEHDQFNTGTGHEEIDADFEPVWRRRDVGLHIHGSSNLTYSDTRRSNTYGDDKALRGVQEDGDDDDDEGYMMYEAPFPQSNYNEDQVHHNDESVNAQPNNLSECKVVQMLHSYKLIVAEWQHVAIVVDRVLFWFYFTATVSAYLAILVIVPSTKTTYWSNDGSGLKVYAMKYTY